ncbi:hypothetical protein L596_012814 [Steinernema carpocapsae]|uniref:Uncharacterized protein n=1 Tax=Steinernema carpocapsae TaxID=34508 RepID=A0A4U5NYC6_STECR|nr:hypothetical protein L596_012814 [Steinernema carpocapsae]
MSRIRKAIAKHNALQKQWITMASVGLTDDFRLNIVATRLISENLARSMTFEARKSIMTRFARAIFPLPTETRLRLRSRESNTLSTQDRWRTRFLSAPAAMMNT